MSHVAKSENGCWIWTGKLHPKAGYGLAMPRYGDVFAHRASYKLFRGEIPKGMHIDHLCRVKRCVNPDHLEVVTPAENNRRGLSRSALNIQKTSCIHGHPFDEANTRLYIGKDGRRVRFCIACTKRRNAVSTPRVPNPSKEELSRLLDEGMNWSELGRMFGVCSTAPASWAKRFGIFVRKSGREPLPPIAKCRKGHPFTTENTIYNTCNGKPSRRCRICLNANMAKRRASFHHVPLTRPTRDELESDIKSGMNFCEIGRKYGVTNVSAKRWAVRFGLDPAHTRRSK